MGDLYWSSIIAARDFELSTKVLSHSNLIRWEVNLGWEPLASGWIKCNVDSACGAYGLMASCGGLLHDSSCQWMTRFNLELGAMDALTLEMRGIVEGLRISWVLGFKRLCLETDSRTALDLINGGGRKDHPLSYLIQEIVELKGRQWDLSLRWCYRECNVVANWLAMEALGRV